MLDATAFSPVAAIGRTERKCQKATPILAVGQLPVSISAIRSQVSDESRQPSLRLDRARRFLGDVAA